MPAQLQILQQSSANSDHGQLSVDAGWSLVEEITSPDLTRLQWGIEEGITYATLGSRPRQPDGRARWSCWFIDPARNLRRAEVWLPHDSLSRAVLVSALRNVGEVKARGVECLSLACSDPGRLLSLTLEGGGARVSALLTLPPELEVKAGASPPG